MIDSLRLRLRSFPEPNFNLPSFFQRNNPPVKSSSNRFIVYLYRGKQLFAFLYAVDQSLSSSVPVIKLINSINVDIPLTVISDSRIDNKEELGEYFEDIIGFFNAHSTPSLLLLDSNYFFNMSIPADDLEKFDFQSCSPYISLDTSYTTSTLPNADFVNISYASTSLLTDWGECLQSTGSKCAYLGSFLFPVVQQLSKRSDPFCLVDIHNAYSLLLLVSEGSVSSKYLPFGINQYLNAESFMADDFVNRLSKSIVKVASDCSITSPRNIYYLSDKVLDSSPSRFFKFHTIADLSRDSSFRNLINNLPTSSIDSSILFDYCSLLASISLLNIFAP